MASPGTTPRYKGAAKTPKGVAGDTKTNKVTVNGTEVSLRAEAETKFEEVLILHQKGDRASLDNKSRLALIEKATEFNEATHFKEVTLAIDAETNLDDCYNINRTIQNVQERHQMYDMHDVFSIVVPGDDAKTLQPEVYNLYTDYASVTPAMVAKSNTWYNTWPSAPTWTENLAWTDRFFKNNVASDLAERVNETYANYPMEARGGPLFFVIMMEMILSQTEEAVIALQSRLKRMDLKTIQGEHVDKAISLCRAALTRLETFGKVPDDIVRILLRIFQTSSVSTFNEFFHHLEQQRKVEQAMSTLKVEDQKVTIQNIFCAATIQYHSLWGEGLWTGVRSGTSTFNATSPGNKGGNTIPIKCWNCGDPTHSMTSCPKPRDAAKISQNKKTFNQAIKNKAKNASGNDSKSSSTTKPTGSTNPSSKWRPPTPEENNRRAIDGRPMKWNARSHRWYPDRNANPATSPTTSASASVAATPPTVSAMPVNTVTVATPGVDARIQATKAAFANAYAVVMQQLDQASM
jgi:hypothetical protein